MQLSGTVLVLPVTKHLIVFCFFCIVHFGNGEIFFTWCNWQSWSRGHKARGQGQGHQKNPRPRPRTAFPRTEPLEAKDRNARGQGQGHRRKCSKKKTFQKSFSGDLQFIAVPRIFDLGRPKPQITCNDIIKIFPKRKFLRDKDIVGWKI